MDEGTRQGSPAVDPAGKSPEELREDIEQTRADLGDTVEALGQKADVKGQAQDRIAQIKDTARAKKDEFASKSRAAMPDSASSGASQVAATARSNPLPLAIAGALVAGFIIGRRSSR